MQSDLLSTVELYLYMLVVVVSLMTIGWLACMIYYDIDPSDLFLYKAIYGTI